MPPSVPATVKISQLPKQPSPTINDKVPLVSSNVTDYALLSDLITLFFNNIPTGTIPGLTTSFVITGGVWTGDSLGVNRNASMTAISVYINNRTIAIAAVTGRTFTASKDTYVDILDNQDGTGTLVYTEVANNAASPALASNSMRIGIIVTGATTIAAAGSINQGQPDKVLPIASSVPYSVADSLGNRICNRDPDGVLLGYRQGVANQTFTSLGTNVQITPCSCAVILPGGRNVKITIFIPNQTATAVSITSLRLWSGSVGGTQLQLSSGKLADVGDIRCIQLEFVDPEPAAGTKTYLASISPSTNNTTIAGAATTPHFMEIKKD